MRVLILGAGTAGCVLAARLSEEPGTEVVLLEAGPHYAPGRWPLELSHAYRIIKETHDWNYLAQAGASPRLVHVPRGRVVGGSSVTNGAIALRGLPKHYDEWSEFVDGYDWQSMLPWFCAIENDGQFPSADYHGDSGPIAINRYPRGEWYPLLEAFAAAALERGHPWIDDHNAPGAIGVGPVPFNMVEGIRQTPADHYLAPALERPNLTLISRITADTIRLDAGRASHVEALGEDGERQRFEADQVILCLGTYASPALLMRSGVGPPEAIRPHGIPVIHPVEAVGRGMQDHPKVSYRFWVSTEIPEWPNPWIQGLLTATCEVDGERRLFQVMPYSGTTEGGHNFTDFNIQVADARGRTGRVDIQGPDPRLQPVLRMGWLEREDDRALADGAGRELMALSQTSPLADAITPWPNQGDLDHPLRTVETFHHPVGTCRMGRESDPTAVVDGAGRLFGLDGLYVMDASIIPRVPSANTHLCVIALAERLAAGFRDAGRG
ncbi:MAG: GMC family oxidoreductase N-terminal domain-containing protein [Thermoleophilia bacterium]|nr:GMC family oxidoreductase N-terminal domain-containing protein [Thermoleophilia bacterium]